MDIEKLEEALLAAQARNRAREEQTQRFSGQLNIIASFLEAEGVSRALVNEFHVLADALDDLKLGIVAPFLKARKVGNRADSTEVWLARALVAIALDVIVESGVSERAAAKVVEEKARSWLYLFGGRDISEKARNWRAQFIKSRAKSKHAQEIFDQRNDLISAEKNAMGEYATPDAIASAVLNYAFTTIARAKGVDELKLLKEMGFFRLG